MVKKQHGIWIHCGFTTKVLGLHGTPGDEDVDLASNRPSGIIRKQDTSYGETGHDLAYNGDTETQNFSTSKRRSDTGAQGSKTISQ